MQASYCSLADGLDGAAHHFGAVGADIEAKGQDAGLQRRQRHAREGQHEIDPEELDEDRGTAEEFDIGRGEPARRAKKRESRPSPAMNAMTSARAEPMTVSSSVTSAPCRIRLI